MLLFLSPILLPPTPSLARLRSELREQEWPSLPSVDRFLISVSPLASKDQESKDLQVWIESRNGVRESQVIADRRMLVGLQRKKFSS